MARRSSFLSAISSAARTMNRMNNAMIADQKRRERYAIQQQKQNERVRKIVAKEQRAAYIQSRINYVDKENNELIALLNQYKSILSDRNKNKPFDIEQLRQRYIQHEFIIPNELQNLPFKPALNQFMPKPLNFFFSLFPKKRKEYADNVIKGEESYKKSFACYELKLAEREEKIEAARQNHILKCDKERDEVNEKNNQLDEVIKGYARGASAMVIAYLEAGLEYLTLPDGCIDFFAIDYNMDSKELNIEYLLPNEDIIPGIESYSYSVNSGAC